MKATQTGSLSIEEKNTINSFASFLSINGSTLVRTDNIELVIDWLKEAYGIQTNIEPRFPGELLKDQYILVRTL